MPAQTLDEYWAKRDFKKTSEPSGRRRIKKSKKPGGIFVVHKHAARRLHYDLRLEHDGVLWSWAVTRGPSLDPTQKRLAVHVEDHPLDYAGFEGVIPPDQYGAGPVIIWDDGVWIPAGDPVAMMKKGHIEFELKGSKLNGTWHLVRLKPRANEQTDNWLLMKSDDAAARSGDILADAPQSARSGLTIDDIKEGSGNSESGSATGGSDRKRPIAKKKSTRTEAERASFPGFIEPCLAMLQAKPPTGDDWLHEVKFDGYRVQAHVTDGKVKLITRSGLDWTEKFGAEIVSVFASLDVADAILDGEIVALSNKGHTSFSALQAALSEGETDNLQCYLFDLLYLDGSDLRSEPLVERKRHLRQLLLRNEPKLLYSEHFAEDGPKFLRHVRDMGLEGVVSKRTDSLYQSGRSHDWLKSKCTLRQEFVIAGYLPSEKTGRGLKSLIMAYHEGWELRPAGNVGTGFSGRVATELKRRLDAIATKSAPFDGPLSRQKDAIWVKPEFVAEVEYRSRTSDNILRHASFIGLREDKPADDVVDETATDPPAELGRPSARTATKTKAKPMTEVKLSSPAKLLWPQAKVTKQQLLEHYELVWPRMETYIVNRPLSLVRAPDGVGGQRFFQKHASPGMHDAIRRMKDPETGDELLYIDNFDGLAALVQYGSVEVHIWGSTIDRIEQPNQIVYDLDPDEGLDVRAVRDATLDVKARLDEVGLPAFVKTSGGKGFHVIVPLKPAADWTAVKTFAHDFANAMEKASPELYTATLSKKARTGRIFIDYLRNGRGSTTVAPWSSRGKDNATVSVPVEWGALEKNLAPDAFTIGSDALKKAIKAADPWADYDKDRKALK